MTDGDQNVMDKCDRARECIHPPSCRSQNKCFLHQDRKDFGVKLIGWGVGLILVLAFWFAVLRLSWLWRH